jgi:hypothetical protein
LKERKFVEAEGDLIALVARLRSLLYRGLEKVSLIRYLFRQGPRDDPVDTGSMQYFSDRRLEVSAAVGVMIVGLALLLGPIWGLEFVHSSLDKLVIITAFVIVFAVLLFCSTTNRRQTTSYEVIAATAAYAAVLAVFLQVNEPN